MSAQFPLIFPFDLAGADIRPEVLECIASSAELKAIYSETECDDLCRELFMHNNLQKY